MTKLSMVLMALTLLPPASVAEQRRSCSDAVLPGGSARQGVFRFDLVRPGVYQAVSSGAIEAISRPVVIVNDADVIVVDSTASAAAACALIEGIKTLTPNPISTLINTHFHLDHSNGNEVFPPGVEIIGSGFTREMISKGGSTRGRAVDFLTRAIGALTAGLRRQIDTTSAAERGQELQRQVANWDGALAGIRGAAAMPPTRTVNTESTLVRGAREIRVLQPGLGHTGGDLVVFLPQEKVLVTGDLLQPAVPYMGDAYFVEWISTLDRLKLLDFEVVIPGHQRPFVERERIGYLQDYLRDLWLAAGKLHAEGVSPTEAAKMIDLRGHANRLSGVNATGVDLTATLRIWEILDGKIR